jgi:photosystem II stability/assembly factor-like uncharacterized protein
MSENNLESLYADARQALKAKEYDRAAGLLTQILVIDENYKDVSRLLAQTVKLKRRRWNNHPALWSGLGFVVLIGLGIWLSRFLPRGTAVLPIESTDKPSLAVIPATATVTLTPTAMPIPLEWKRINYLPFVSRDETSSLVIDPTDPDVMYVGTKHAGIYRSFNGGISWEPAFAGLLSSDIDSLAMDPNRPSTLYAAVNSGGVYKSTDRANNWYQVLKAPNYFSGISNFVRVAKGEPKQLYYTNGVAFYESTDFGESWKIVYDPDKHINQCPQIFEHFEIHPVHSQVLVAVDPENDRLCGTAVFMSHDGGKSWQSTEAKSIIEDWPGNIAIDQEKGSTIYVSIGNKVFKSTDTGITWHEVFQNSCTEIAVSPVDINKVYCAPGKLWISNNGGENWNSSDQTIMPELTPGFLVVSPGDPSTLYRSKIGIYVSTDDGSTWGNLDNGLGAKALELVIDPTTSTWYLFNTWWNGYLYESNDQGYTWNPVGKDRSSGLEIDADGKAIYRFEFTGNFITRSMDHGKNWTKLQVPLQSLQEVFTHPLQSGTIYIVGVNEQDDGYTYISTDFGATWDEIQDLHGTFDGFPGRFFFHPSNTEKIYSIPWRSAKGYRTSDGGFSWEVCSRGGDNYDFSNTATRIAIDPDNINKIYAATETNGIIISENNCSSWFEANNGLDAIKVNSIVVDPRNSSIVYAGTDIGFYISYEKGKNWAPVNDGLLGANTIYSIAIDPNNPANIYVTTPYGIFKLESK